MSRAARNVAGRPEFRGPRHSGPLHSPGPGTRGVVPERGNEVVFGFLVSCAWSDFGKFQFFISAP